MDSYIKKVLEKLVEGEISLDEAWLLINPEYISVNSKKHSNKLTNNKKDFLTVRMF